MARINILLVILGLFTFHDLRSWNETKHIVWNLVMLEPHKESTIGKKCYCREC